MLVTQRGKGSASTSTEKRHLESRKGRAAVVVSSSWELPATRPGTTAAVEGGLDGDGGVARAVEPQGLSVARQG